MADEQTATTTIRAAIANTNAKIVLAFFLTIIAALMVVFLLVVIVKAPANKIDAGTIALIASMVMLFIKMAADACGYQTNSSAGSDKKDDTSATVQKALADKVAPASPAAPAVEVKSWWTRFDNEETTKIMAAAEFDDEVKAIIARAKDSKATPADLDYLVSKNLLSPDRANAIQKV